MNEEELLEKAETAMRDCLARVPGLEIESLEREPLVGDIRVDLLVSIRLDQIKQRLVFEVKNNGQPRVARAAAYQLSRIQKSAVDLYGVFVAPYISPQAAEICNQEGIGYLDLAGNCRLSFRQIFIAQGGNPNPTAEKRDLRSLYSPRAARIVRVLLNEPQKTWRVVALAGAAKVSLGQVSNVKKLLEDREWLMNDETGFRLKDPDKLLSEFVANYNFKKHETRSYYTMKNLSEIEAVLAEICVRKGILYALTGFSGAARYAPAVRYQRATAYIDQDVEDIATELALKDVSSGANVSLLKPYDEGVFFGARDIDGQKIASPVQVFLDLMSMKGRGEEAASAVLDRVIKRSW